MGDHETLGAAPASSGAGARRGAGPPVLVYLLLAFAITWAVWVPRMAEDVGWLGGDAFGAVGTAWTYGPAVAAVLAAAWTAGRAGLRDLGSRLARWRVGWRGWVLVVAAPLALLAATQAFALLLGTGPRLSLPEGGLGGLAVVLVLISLTDGLGEEVGWRGWLLPRLLERTRALEASLLLGVVWAAWHLPLHWTDGSYLAGVPVWTLFARLPATAIVFTWVYRHTHGSTLVAVLLHAAVNVTLLVGPEGTGGAVAGAAAHWAVALALLLVAGRDLGRWPGVPVGTGAAERSVPGP